MNKVLFLLFLITICSFTVEAQNDDKKIDSILNSMTKSKGLITTYLKEDKLFFRLHKDVLNKDLLMVTRLKKLPANYYPYRNAGSKTSEQLIRFVRSGDDIDIVQVSTTNMADKDDPINISVEQNNNDPILASFPIKSDKKKTFVIDVSKFFNADSPSFNVVSDGLKKKYKIGKADKDRSRINSAKSFPRNTEILHTLTFPTKNPPRGNSTNTFTFQVNHSIIALPDDPMKVRYEDPRVGWFSLTKYDYSSDALKADKVKLIKKWRLVPKDKIAYAKGELVEPEQPIIYYLDPATPKKWRKYFIMGIEDWNTAFEKAGFKNAVQAKMAPTQDEDPDFSPEDVRFSTVRYVASTTRNAVGPSVADPRTGEILESDIIWYHNHLRSYRNRYLLETAAANPKARTLNTPEEEIGEMMRRVISHEVGHALGLPHNMKASSAYPVDSLRSGRFTQKNGIATTIMDYARYNYVAQPGDKNIRFVRKLGPYDDYAIEFGYRYFTGNSAEQDKKLLKSFVDKHSTDPKFMFGGRGNDPAAQTEDIGRNHIKASEYGLSNLKIVADNLVDWTTEEDDDFTDLGELHGEMLGVFRRYIFHVVSMVGGVNETLLTKEQAGVPYQVVDRQEQINALSFLADHVWEPSYWLIDKKMVSNFASEGKLSSLININKRVLSALTDHEKLNLMLDTTNSLKGKGLEPGELLGMLSDDLIGDIERPDLAQRELQKHLVHRLHQLMENDKAAMEIKGLALQQLNKMKAHFEALPSDNDIQEAHYDYMVFQIESILEKAD